MSRAPSLTRTPEGAVPAGSATATSASSPEIRSALLDSTWITVGAGFAACDTGATSTVAAARTPMIAAIHADLLRPFFTICWISLRDPVGPAQPVLGYRLTRRPRPRATNSSSVARRETAAVVTRAEPWNVPG